MQRVLHESLEVKLLSGIIIRLSKKSSERGTVRAKIGMLGCGVLHMLHHNELTISELSDKLFLSSATLVPVIDVLEKNGFVKRGHDAQDRRRNPLLLTAKGEKVLKVVPLLSEHDVLVEKMKKIGNKKREELLSNLRLLVAEMIGKDKLEELVKFAQEVEIN